MQVELDEPNGDKECSASRSDQKKKKKTTSEFDDEIQILTDHDHSKSIARFTRVFPLLIK